MITVKIPSPIANGTWVTAKIPKKAVNAAPKVGAGNAKANWNEVAT